MPDSPLEVVHPAPIEIKRSIDKYKNDLASNATGEMRRKLDTRVKTDYDRLQSIKTESPESWQTYLSIVKKEQEAEDQHHRIYRESTRQVFLKAREVWENHPFYQLVRRLDRNYAQLKGAVLTAKKLGVPYKELSPEFTHTVESLLNEAYTGYPYPVSSEEKAA